MLCCFLGGVRGEKKSSVGGVKKKTNQRKKTFCSSSHAVWLSAEEACNYCAQCKVFLLLVHLLNKHVGFPMILPASVFSFLCRFCLFLQEPLCSDSKATPSSRPWCIRAYSHHHQSPFPFVTDCFSSRRHVDALKSVMSGFMRGSFIFYSAAEPRFSARRWALGSVFRRPNKLEGGREARKLSSAFTSDLTRCPAATREANPSPPGPRRRTTLKPCISNISARLGRHVQTRGSFRLLAKNWIIWHCCRGHSVGGFFVGFSSCIFWLVHSADPLNHGAKTQQHITRFLLLWTRRGDIVRT